jgi:histone H3/H4
MYNAAVQKRRTNKFLECFRKLGEEFTIEMFTEAFGYANNHAGQKTLERLIEDKAIERIQRGKYRKLVSEL